MKRRAGGIAPRADSSGLIVLLLFLSTSWRMAAAEESQYVDAGRGDVRVVLPSNRDPQQPLPLILLLHQRCKKRIAIFFSSATR